MPQHLVLLSTVGSPLTGTRLFEHTVFAFFERQPQHLCTLYQLLFGCSADVHRACCRRQSILEPRPVGAHTRLVFQRGVCDCEFHSLPTMRANSMCCPFVGILHPHKPPQLKSRGLLDFSPGSDLKVDFRQGYVQSLDS